MRASLTAPGPRALSLWVGMFRKSVHARRFGRSAERFTAPEEVALFFECLRLLGARVADCTWAAGAEFMVGYVLYTRARAAFWVLC